MLEVAVCQLTWRATIRGEYEQLMKAVFEVSRSVGAVTRLLDQLRWFGPLRSVRLRGQFSQKVQAFCSNSIEKAMDRPSGDQTNSLGADVRFVSFRNHAALDPATVDLCRIVRVG